MDKLANFFGTGLRKGKGRGGDAAAFNDAEPGEDEPLLAGEAGGEDHQHASTIKPATDSSNRNSAVVRHGRGLLSEDGDEDDNDNNHSRSPYKPTSRGDHRHPAVAGQEDDQLLDEWEAKHSRRRRASWKSLACYTIIFMLGIAFVAFAIIHVWVGRFVSEQLKDDGALIKERAPDALVWQGPDSVKILNMDSDSTTVRVNMRVGLDVRTALGWNNTSSEQVKKLPLSRRLERRIIGWMTRRVGLATMDLPSPVTISDPASLHTPILAMGLAAPLALPLHFPKLDNYDPHETSWLRPVSLDIPVEVLDANLMADFINSTMAAKKGRVHVLVKEARVSLGKEEARDWMTRIVQKYGGRKIENIEVDQSFDVPESPDMPDPETLVDLKSYSLVALPNNSTHHNSTTKPSETLAIYATARIQNPGYEQLHKYSLDLDIPFAWPYKIYLSAPHNKTDLIQLARGVVEPFSIPSNSKHFDVSINGTVEHTYNSSTPLSQALSSFISRYLAGKSNTVHVTFDPDSPFAKRIPAFLPPLLAKHMVTNDVPGLPAEERDLLKDLKIGQMRIHGSETGGSGWECDGEIQGKLAMPQGLDQLEGGINVTQIWPDIVLYDGLPPPGEDKKVPPVPLPSNAFARFRTRDWAPAETAFDKASNATIMRSMVRNVPLDIIRSDVLQRWIAKIIFSGGKGALTGIKGVTEARSTVRAFGEVELHNLPVLGTFYANKPSLISLKNFGLLD